MPGLPCLTLLSNWLCFAQSAMRGPAGISALFRLTKMCDSLAMTRFPRLTPLLTCVDIICEFRYGVKRNSENGDVLIGCRKRPRRQAPDAVLGIVDARTPDKMIYRKNNSYKEMYPLFPLVSLSKVLRN